MAEANATGRLKIRRALITVSDKRGALELARALRASGAEIVATGNTARILVEGGVPVVPIERISGSPEAFQGRMKTLSFPVCSGILYRRGDSKDEADLKQLGIQPIDCVVVNFYPFEQASAKPKITRSELIEEVDIGGPTLVRAAAKNAPNVLVLTSPDQYARVIEELGAAGTVSHEAALTAASDAWQKILSYDQAIARELAGGEATLKLRYGENPHQSGWLEVDSDSPVDWSARLTPSELSYNNLLDLASAYAIASDLVELSPDAASVVILKHNNPCGMAVVPTHDQAGTALPAGRAQRIALERAWAGDPVSAFGGVVVFTTPLTEEAAGWLAERFVDVVAAPGLSGDSAGLLRLISKRRNLKAVPIRRFGEVPAQNVVHVPGGKLWQTVDHGLAEGKSSELKSVTRAPYPKSLEALTRFGISAVRALKSNAIALVREVPKSEGEGGGPGAFQLVGAGQGQPNRIDALAKLAIPRAVEVLSTTQGNIGSCILISDAFFPFRDAVDAAHAGGIRFIVQPGGSIKDKDSIAACDEHGIAMAFTGIRHFKH